MSYESEDYRNLKAEIARLDTIRAFVDLARQFQGLKYRGQMTVSSGPKSGPYEPSVDGITLNIPDDLKAAIIKEATAWCIDWAQQSASAETKAFDIVEAVKI